MTKNTKMRVNLDVMGWTSEMSAFHEAECLNVIEIARTVVAYGYDAIELAEAIDEYQQGRLFKQITVSINAGRETTVVTLFAIGVEKEACQ